MKKVFIVLVLTLMLTLALVACNEPCVHNVVIDEAIDATCVDSGLTAGAHCTLCNKVLVEQEVILANGHIEVADEAVAPSCLNAGLTEGSHCSVCDEIIVAQETVSAKGHTSITDEAVAPTCTKSGLTEGSHCSVCNEIIVEQEVVAATDHTVVTDKAVEPSCIDTGLTSGSHCSVCNIVLVEQLVVPSRGGHTIVIDEAVDATCVDTGLTAGAHCSVCNAVLVKQETVDATGIHTEVIVEAVAPTCSTPGKAEGKYCSVCNKVIVQIVTEPATGIHVYEGGCCTMCGILCEHNYEDGACTICGKSDKYIRVDEDTILFGSYPQTEVKDESVVSALNALTGDLPVYLEAESGNWKSYGYYMNSELHHYMWYTDVEYNGEKYRGVYCYFNRPTSLGGGANSINSNQPDYGYETRTIYWFKYEPIKWTIYASSPTAAYIISELVIDSQSFDNNDDGVYTNDYDNSAIRKWLNEEFYNTAFSELEKELIGAVSNIEEVELIPRHFLDKDNEFKKVTDYSKMQGVAVVTEHDIEFWGVDEKYLGFSAGWWLSNSVSTGDAINQLTKYVYVAGKAEYCGFGSTEEGVVPALVIKL